MRRKCLENVRKHNHHRECLRKCSQTYGVSKQNAVATNYFLHNAINGSQLPNITVTYNQQISCKTKCDIKRNLLLSPDLWDNILLTLWCVKNINLPKMLGKSCFVFKNVGCFFCAAEDPQTDPFLGYSNEVSDMIVDDSLS